MEDLINFEKSDIFEHSGVAAILGRCHFCIFFKGILTDFVVCDFRQSQTRMDTDEPAFIRVNNFQPVSETTKTVRTAFFVGVLWGWRGIWQSFN